ncbi:MAG: polysaccharide deacetylase family protein [Burkholderiales bacterium]|nr:polysaccharide deacetylase family protein [Burkholderiales bacterium]
MLTAINFHYVRPEYSAPYPGIHGVTPREFENQLDQLSRVFTYVSGDDIRSTVMGARSLARNALVVTFDDGLREQYDHAWPILQRKGIPAIFYVNTRPIAERTVSRVHQLHMVRAHTPPEEMALQVEGMLAQFDCAIPDDLHDQAVRQYRYDEAPTARVKYLLNFVLGEAQRDALIANVFRRMFGSEEASVSESLYMSMAMVAALAHEGCIGTHGHDHLPLAQLTAHEASIQLTLSLDLLTAWGCSRIQGVSYPYGGRTAVSEEVARLSMEAGMNFGFTMERATNLDLKRPLLLARFSNSDMPGGNASAWSLADLPHRLPVAAWFQC